MTTSPPLCSRTPWQEPTGQQSANELTPVLANAAAALPSRPRPDAVGVRSWVPVNPEILRRVRSALDRLLPGTSLITTEISGTQVSPSLVCPPPRYDSLDQAESESAGDFGNVRRG